MRFPDVLIQRARFVSPPPCLPGPAIQLFPPFLSLLHSCSPSSVNRAFTYLTTPNHPISFFLLFHFAYWVAHLYAYFVSVCMYLFRNTVCYGLFVLLLRIWIVEMTTGRDWAREIGIGLVNDPGQSNTSPTVVGCLSALHHRTPYCMDVPFVSMYMQCGCTPLTSFSHVSTHLCMSM